MRRLFAPALTLALTLSIAATAHASIDDTLRRGFTVQEGGKLTIRAALGDVTIVTGGSGVAVEIVRTARTDDDSRAKEIFGDLKINFSQQGNDVVIDSDYERDSFFNFGDSRLRVKWNIRVPDRYNVDVRTSGGNIKLDPIDGTVDAKTSGGNINAGRVTGTFHAITSGGDVDLAGADGDIIARTSGGDITIGESRGPVEARTSGGSITLSRVGGEVNARTSGGDIMIREARGSIDAVTSGGSIVASFSQQPRSESRLSTSGGNVKVAFASGIAAEIDAKTSGGNIDADIPVTVIGTQSRGTLQGSIGSGGPKLTLRTSGGGIRIQPVS